MDSYSAFSDPKKLVKTKLEGILRDKGVTDVYICGLAWDYCVGNSALDAQDLGFRTILVEDCIRGFDNDNIKRMKTNIGNQLLVNIILKIMSLYFMIFTLHKILLFLNLLNLQSIIMA